MIKLFNKIKKPLSIVVFFLILAFLIIYIQKNWVEFQTIRLISLSNFSLLMLVVPVYFIVQGIILKVILSCYGINLKFKEWFGLTAVTLFGNLIFPFGGAGLRATYLKKYHSFEYSWFISTLFLDLIINFIIYTAGGVLALFLIYLKSNFIDKNLLIIFSIVIFASFLCWFFPKNILKSNNFFLKRVNLVMAHWYEVKKNYSLIWRLIFWSFFQFIFGTLIFYFSALSLGFRITLIDSFLPNCLSLYALIISFVPASLGFYEGAVVWGFHILGFTIPQGLALSIVSRLAVVSWTLVLGLIFGYLLFKLKFRNKDGNFNQS